jgi:hypothetical protein
MTPDPVLDECESLGIVIYKEPKPLVRQPVQDAAGALRLVSLGPCDMLHAASMAQPNRC